MMTPTQLLQGILHISFQAALLILLIFATRAILRRWMSPGWTYGLWFLVMLKLVVPAGPQTVFSISNYLSPLNLMDQNKSRPITLPGMPGLPVADSISISALPADAAATNTGQDIIRFIRHYSTSILLIAWATGAGVVLFLLFSNTRNLANRLLRSDLVQDPALLEQFASCCRELGISRSVQLRTGAGIESPALVGIMRPIIVLPEPTIATCSPSELRYIFLHELMHLQRRDILVGCLSSLLQALHWFNPLLWIAFTRMRADREIACDAQVLGHIGEAHAADYGRTILKLAANGPSPLNFAGAVGILEVTSETERRIIMLSRFRKSTRRDIWVAVIVAALLGAVSFTDAVESTSVAATAVTYDTAGQKSIVEFLSAMSLITDVSFYLADGVDPEIRVTAKFEDQPLPDALDAVLLPIGLRWSRTANVITVTPDLRGLTPEQVGRLKSQLPAGGPVPVDQAGFPGIMPDNKPFQLWVDDEDGELNYEFSETGKELTRIRASKGVVFSSGETTITCSTFTYDVKIRELLALGPDLTMQQGKSRYTAQKILFYPDKDHCVLEGDATITSTGVDGRETVTSGDRIVIASENGELRSKSTNGRISSRERTLPPANTESSLTR